MGKPSGLPGHSGISRLFVWFWAVLVLFALPVTATAAADSVCADVKIEIRQELTLERQAFDAHMRINNGLSHILLENVAATVSVKDAAGNTVRASSDPNDTAALFFVRIDSLQNIDAVNGSGAVSPASSADIHWLIIPAPGSSNGLNAGTLYYVGATLSYTIGGETHTTEVTPDYIFVKPMPELTLDYFLPTDVLGDDPWTAGVVEPPIPFTLGVRVRNSGAGSAKSLKIDSAQPKIVENSQGLLVGFVIQGSEVNGRPATASLLADLGDIAPDGAKAARWFMTCTLSGRFVDFRANFSHSDELGGQLTSLFEAAHTHFSVRDVLADLPGRDTVRDFLAKESADSEIYTLYESNGQNTPVSNQSVHSTLQYAWSAGAEIRYTLTAPATAGFMVVKLPDPHNGQKILKQVLRSDGKVIKPENAWLSKKQQADHSWQHFVNLFDVNTTNAYTLVFDAAAQAPHAPVLGPIANQSGLENNPLTFTVSASDPDGTIPALSAAPLPVGATFVDRSDGTGLFSWTPVEGQAGAYTITFKASDGALEDSQAVVVTINAFGDTDKDGLPDDWEMAYFGNLDRDGSGDYDGDGISDLDEYLNGTDPAESNAPGIPVIFAPHDASEVPEVQPDLVVNNSTDPDGDVITYEFEVYADEGLTMRVAYQPAVPETAQQTGWTVTKVLNDNTRYYWRVRAGDGTGFSQWVQASFFVNTQNDPPGAFQISSPVDNSEVDTLTPILVVTNSMDVDEDTVIYTFEIYADSAMSQTVATSADIVAGSAGATAWSVTNDLDDNTWYYWRAIATDEHGAMTETALSSFFVNTANDAPSAPQIVSPVDGSEVTVQELDLIAANALDLDGDALAFIFELDTVNTFDGPHKQTSDPISAEAEGAIWPVSGLSDNTRYYWRVKADDGAAQSPWAVGSFFVNMENDAPSVPTVKNPGHAAWVSSLMPTLELNPAVDVDEDVITYRFELYSDEALSQLVAETFSDSLSWTPPAALLDNHWYYWRARAEDEHGLAGDWMAASAFFTDQNGIDDPPWITFLEPDVDFRTHTNVFIRWDDGDPETNAAISLFYDTDRFGEDGVEIISGLAEDPDGEDDTFIWDITGVGEGTYYIYAVISDSNSIVTVYSPTAVTIDKTPPVAEAGDDQDVEEGAEILLDGSASYDPDNGTVSYRWEQTGGAAVSLSDPEAAQVSFEAPDAGSGGETLTFVLTVTDAVGLESTDPVTIQVYNSAPVVDAVADLMTDEGTAVDFTAGFSDPGRLDTHSAQIDWGDDTVSAGIVVSVDGSGTVQADHVYSNDGVYTVTLTITDDDGAAGSTTFTVTVNNVAPAAVAGADQYADEGAEISFSGSFTDPGNDVQTILWNFGDGATAGGSLTPTHTYADNGAYTVTLTVTDDDGAVGTDTLTVTVNNVAPVANAGDDQSVSEGIPVVFSGSFTDAGSSDTHAILWNFGDNSTADSTLTPTHTYADNGVYTVTLTVTDDDQGVGTDTLIVEVTNTVPTITYFGSNSPSNGMIEFSAAFSDKGWQDSHTALFNFGDGTEGAGQVEGEKEPPDATGTVSGNYTYEQEGRFTASLVVIDDDGGSSVPMVTDVIIDKSPPLITIAAPVAGNYFNLQEITIDFTVEDPVSSGISSGLVPDSIVATLDGQVVSRGQVVDLSMLEDRVHVFQVAAIDHAGNATQQEVVFEVGPVPALVHIEPHNWSLGWLDPFEEPGEDHFNDNDEEHDRDRNEDGYEERDKEGEKERNEDKQGITAYISLENAEVETIIPTTSALFLAAGDVYGDFVIASVVPVPADRRPGRKSIQSLSLNYVGSGKVDILMFSGNKTWDFYGVQAGQTINIDAGEGQCLADYTVVSYYGRELPPYSTANIIPETIRLNGKVPIIEGGAELIVKDASTLQPLARAEAPFIIADEGLRRVLLTNLGDPRTITLKVGDQTLFEDEPYPIRWHDRFSLTEDGPRQMMAINASPKENLLRIIYHNLQAEARIYLDSALALTILPDEPLLVLKVGFNRFDAMASLPGEVLARGGEWQISTYEGIRLKGKQPRKHLTLTRLGEPRTARLVVGDRLIFDNEPFPIRWKDRFFLVDGERQDLSIYTFGKRSRDRYLSVHCSRLTREARLYFDDKLVLVISPPPDVDIGMTGTIELDGNPETFDGSFAGSGDITLTGKIPKKYDISKIYQRINTSGAPPLQQGDVFGDFTITDFIAEYDDYRITELRFRYDGKKSQDIEIHTDRRGRDLLGSYSVSRGEVFAVDLSTVAEDEIYLTVGKHSTKIDLAGKKAVEIGDRFSDNTVVGLTRQPLGPPHYLSVTLSYTASGPITITAYDGKWQDVIGTYLLDPAVNPSITINGNGRSKGNIGGNLVLEY